MAAPVISPIDPARIPQRDGTQNQGQYSDNMDYFAGKLPTTVTDINTSTAWIDARASDASASATQAAANANTSSSNVAASQLAQSNSEAAAAASQQAAGLTPNPSFGMVIATNASNDVKTSTYTAVIGKVQDLNTSGGVFGITTPSSPTIGQWIGFRDINQKSFGDLFPWLIYGSDRIIGLQEDCFLDANTLIFTWRGSAKGWCL